MRDRSNFNPDERATKLNGKTQNITRAELLSLISEYISRIRSKEARNGVTIWALISGVVLIGAYLFNDVSIIFHPSAAAVFVNIILFIEIAKDILTHLKGSKVGVFGVLDVTHYLDVLHYALIVQMAKWLLLLGLVVGVLEDTYFWFGSYVIYKVFLLITAFLIRHSKVMQSYAQTVAYGTGVTGSIGAYFKGLVLSFTIIHYSAYIAPITLTSLRTCIGFVLIVYTIEYMANKFISRQNEVRIALIERELLKSKISVESAAHQVADIMFGKTTKQVLDEEFAKFQRALVIPDPSDARTSRIGALHNAEKSALMLLKKLKKALKFDRDTVRIYRREVYRILCKLRTIAARED